uniref:Myb/SANT-like domain-containing protein n=1 Tax=Glycine max TaxID=3847 RepID=A0A0R0FYP2_SOYBN
MERVLADVLRDQRNLGNKGDGGWKRSALNVAAAVSWYGIVSDILGQSGFDWDGTKHMITIENENAWNEYCTVSIL